jgi:branched-chain amino acid transport system ATP-binding protein
VADQPEMTGVSAAKEGRPMLVVRELSIAYGSRLAVADASLSVWGGEAIGIVGHNGAGKTSLLRGIFGLIRPSSGAVEYSGTIITGLRPDQLVKRGMGMIPAERAVFGRLSVEENLALAAEDGSQRRSATDQSALSRRLFPEIWSRQSQLAGTLSGGEQRMLSVAMLLLRQPRLLLLDEPSLGLAPAVVQRLFAAFHELSDKHGVSIICVEQNLAALLAIAQRIYVVRAGKVVRELSGAELDEPENLWELQ